MGLEGEIVLGGVCSADLAVHLFGGVHLYVVLSIRYLLYTGLSTSLTLYPIYPTTTSIHPPLMLL